MAKYVEPNERGLFDQDDRLQELHEMGDPLARLDEVIDWRMFDSVLARLPQGVDSGPGRPRLRPSMLLKALIIQSLYQLSDAQMEFQITDRLSFKRFLGLSDADKSPDEKTIWAFRNALVGHGLIGELFKTFDDALRSKGMIANKGQMVDASFVEVPRQRNSREENAQIKRGDKPSDWSENPSKGRQKDVDARWTKKDGKSFYGYKNHVKVDGKSKLITRFKVTAASVHDSQVLDDLIEAGDSETYADSAYTGRQCEEVFTSKGVKGKPVEKACRNRPLDGNQKRNNRARSKHRVRVEHVFGTMRMSMRATWNRCIGKIRNEAAIAMTNLTYNMIRFEQIERLGLKNWTTT